MSDAMRIRLTRELRFGLHEPAGGGPGVGEWVWGVSGAGGYYAVFDFAGDVSGEVDPATGMMVNIKQVDRVLRQLAVPGIRRGHYHEKLGAAVLVRRVFEEVKGEFGPHVLEGLAWG